MRYLGSNPTGGLLACCVTGVCIRRPQKSLPETLLTYVLTNHTQGPAFAHACVWVPPCCCFLNPSHRLRTDTLSWGGGACLRGASSTPSALYNSSRPGCKSLWRSLDRLTHHSSDTDPDHALPSLASVYIVPTLILTSNLSQLASTSSLACSYTSHLSQPTIPILAPPAPNCYTWITRCRSTCTTTWMPSWTWTRPISMMSLNNIWTQPAHLSLRVPSCQA